MIADVLEKHHAHIDKYLRDFLESVRSGNPSNELFNRAMEGLHNHIYWEETILFRSIESPDNRARVHGLEVEHGGIWQLLDKIGAYVDEGKAELAIDRLEGLLRVLVTHNSAEEGTVYPMLDQKSGEEQAELIETSLDSPVAPQGWKCATLRKYSRR